MRGGEGGRGGREGGREGGRGWEGGGGKWLGGRKGGEGGGGKWLVRRRVDRPVLLSSQVLLAGSENFTLIGTPILKYVYFITRKVVLF